MSDLISRQAAIAYLISGMTREIDGDKWIRVSEVRESIKTMPSAQPETAKRIVGKSRGGMTRWYQCDMCNEPVDAQDNFCRGCGRRLTDG